MEKDYIHIILADDDEDDRLFFTDAFDELKMKTKVQTYNDGVELMKNLAENSGLNPVIHAGGVGGSDHVSFYKSSIAAIGFHTGGHLQYHTPEDDIELINHKGGALVSQYIYNALISIANYAQPLYFIEQDK